MTDQNMTSQTNLIQISNEAFSTKEYNAELAKIITKFPGMKVENFSSNPIVIDQKYLDNSERLCEILNSVLVMYAYNYVRDERLHQLYQFDKELIDILLLAEGTPFEIGMYKVTFVFDQHGNPKINGIDAQVPLKDWLSSGYLNQVTQKLASEANSNWDANGDQLKFLEEIGGLFDNEDTLFVISTDENKSDEDDLLQELKEVGITATYVQPSDFSLEDGNLKVGDQIARQFFLEVSVDDLRSFDRAILTNIVQSGRCLNDIRTLVLINNKKILAGFFNQRIMGSYINMEDHNFFSPYLIPSYILSSQEDIDFMNNSQDNWILKKCNEPDGEGIFIRGDYSSEEWNELMLKDWRNYMVQPMIVQKEFTSNEQKVHLTGRNLYFNGKSFGPGFFASSTLETKANQILPYVIQKTEE